MATWQDDERHVQTLNKFCKIYINGFEGAKEIRERLMKSSSARELLASLSELLTVAV
jgi:tRNA-dihydrouridine synthase